MNDSVLLPGTQIAGRYEIRKLLGTGGMAHVYRAWDGTLCRDIALKTIRFDRAGDARSADVLKARLLREAQAAAQLNHPNIVVIHDLSFESSVPYISMELVIGKNLRELFDVIHTISLNDLISIARQVASALDFAHSRDVIHRDIKPENVMITADYTAKITDFGIARVQSPDFSTLTTDGKIMCTYHYTAPEYFKGEKGSSKGDLFSFGCLLYELFTGQLAFSGDSEPQVWWQIMHSTPIAPSAVNPAIPPDVDPVILGMLNRAPDLRPVGCLATVERIEIAFSGVNAQQPIVPEHRSSPSPTIANDCIPRMADQDATTRSDTIPVRRWLGVMTWGIIAGCCLGIAFWWGGNRIAPRGMHGGAIQKVVELPAAPSVTPVPQLVQPEPFTPAPTVSESPHPQIVPLTPSPVPSDTIRPVINTSPTKTPTTNHVSRTISIQPKQTPGDKPTVMPTPDVEVIETASIPTAILSEPTATTTVVKPENATPTSARRRDDAWMPF